MKKHLDDWWEPKPLTEEQMKQEIAFSGVKGKPHQEFTPETITKTLDALNLKSQYADGNRERNEAGRQEAGKQD